MSNSALSQSAFTTALAIQMHLQIETDFIIPIVMQHMPSSQSMQPHTNRFWPGIFGVDVKQLFATGVRIGSIGASASHERFIESWDLFIEEQSILEGQS